MLKIMLESYCKPVPYHDDGGIQLSWKLVRLLDDMEANGILPPPDNFGPNWDKTNDYTPVQQLNWDDEENK